MEVEWYHLFMLTAFMLTALIGWITRTPRVILWVGALAASYGLSLLYLYAPKPFLPGMWWPPASGVTMLLDAGVCLLIYTFGKRSWETKRLYALVLLMVGVSLAYATNDILGGASGAAMAASRNVYGSILEAINLAALMLIGGSAILRRIGGADGHSFSRRHLAPIRALGADFLKAHRPSDALRKK